MYCFVGLDNIIMVFTSGFTKQVIYIWQGGYLISVWGDDDNLIILNVGVLLLIWKWAMWVSCNAHDMIKLFVLHLN